MADEPTECPTCGAAIMNTGKHRRWHEALDKVAPGIDAAVKRIARREDADCSRPAGFGKHGGSVADGSPLFAQGVGPVWMLPHPDPAFQLTSGRA